MAKGQSGAIRQQALKTSDLNAAERHGKRQDNMSQARRVSDAAPLVHGTLDLADARKAHMDGVQQQGKTAALHVLVQFPTQLKLSDDPDLRESQQRSMLQHAVRFVNEYHGGDAVFGARFDRDEQGQHTVDVFAMPKYEFRYKDGRTAQRASVSKFSKEQALARFNRNGPRSQGKAIQAAWFEYMRDEMGLDWIQPPTPKKSRTKDRLEPEEYKLQQDRQKLRDEKEQVNTTHALANAVMRRGQEKAAELDAREHVIFTREVEIERRELALGARESVLSDHEKQLSIERAAVRSVAEELKKPQVLHQLDDLSAAQKARQKSRDD